MAVPFTRLKILFAWSDFNAAPSVVRLRAPSSPSNDLPASVAMPRRNGL
jgi:hypothetical protein